MLATYASLLVVLASATVIGQAVFAACGRREWTPLAPAVGIAGLLGLAWATVRIGGEGVSAMIAIGVVDAVALGVLFRVGFSITRDDLLTSVAVGLGAVIAASIPFAAGGHFGILGTGLNPDMSQHLIASDRLQFGGTDRLLVEGYPLGPHSLSIALTHLGPGIVSAFSAVTIAAPVILSVAALAALREVGLWTRMAVALLVGFAYMLASNHIQGAFKESLEALFVVAFVIGLTEISRNWGELEPGRRRLLAGVPLAVLGIGAVYSYSFPGLLWIGGALLVWGAVELIRISRAGAPGAASRALRWTAPTLGVGLGVFAAGALPEIGRMIEFSHFETFDPDGPGLGNLFNRLSPFESLGIWPSGDFRVEPGAGAAPAIVFYVGAAFGLAVLGYGLWWWWKRSELVAPAAFAVALALWLYTLLIGTGYQESKALVIGAPLITLIGVRALAMHGPPIVLLAFLAAAGGSSALALVNGPVGPGGYTPELRELARSGDLGDGSVYVTAPAELLDEQHGSDYLTWELRGNRICVGPEGSTPPAGISAELSVGFDDDGAVVPVSGPVFRAQNAGKGPCPLVSDTGRADPAGDD